METYGTSLYEGVHHPEHVTVVDDPVLGSAREVLRLETHNTDTGPTENPRTEVNPPLMLGPGEDYWAGFGVYFPADWPALPTEDDWVVLGETYGPPYNGSSPIFLRQISPFSIALLRNGNHSWDKVWSTPIVTEQWYDFALKFRLSTDPAGGFYELWLNTGTGWTQQLLLGQPRLHFATLDDTNSGGPNRYALKNYRRANLFPDPHAVYFAGHRIGRSLSEVDPHSHG